MELELFTVYMKEQGKIKIEINEEVVNAYGMTLEDFQEKFNTDNLAEGIQDFVNCLSD
jgi:hypothetical protein